MGRDKVEKEKEDETSDRESSMGSNISGISGISGINEIGADIWTGEDQGQVEKSAWIPEASSEGTTSTVEISMSCRDLLDKDTFSKSDPMIVVLHKPPGFKFWAELMRSEIIQNDLNPEFAAKVMIEYFFERSQPLRFQVHHMDTINSKLTPENSLGFCELSLSQIVKAGSEGLIIELSGVESNSDTGTIDQPKSRIILVAEELAFEKMGEISLKIGGHSIGSWSGCFPPNSIYVISKLMYHDEKYLVVYRSEGRRGQSPVWSILNMSSRFLCNGDFSRALKIDVYLKTISSGLVHVGCVVTNINGMLSQNPKDKILLMTETGQMTKSSIRIISCLLTPSTTFIDYIQSPMQIHCCFAIDFTCSNGNPEDAESLHFISTKTKNLYEQAIQAVGNILVDYDTSNLYPTFGFGARIPPYGEISYNFHVNLTDSPNCGSIAGVLEAYKECMTKIELYGPTYFAPVIKTLADMARKSKWGDNYYILAILTDGIITDVEQTKKIIVEASVLPLSIIIIGLGEADFDETGIMEELDGDSVRLSYRGKKAERDIVQFVAYRSARLWQTNTGEATIDQNEQNRNRIIQVVPENEQEDEDEPQERFIIETEDKRERAQRLLAQSQLAQEVLAEIPEQLTSYMKARGITPSMIKVPPNMQGITNTVLASKKVKVAAMKVIPPTPPAPASTQQMEGKCVQSFLLAT